mmetsp:Transcript_80199/g.179573  ORF Transcript_80199/g.179573 Transcript_80199/m.179573 type:complete len:211 (-) Transcript_80199:336-968(-)
MPVPKSGAANVGPSGGAGVGGANTWKSSSAESSPGSMSAPSRSARPPPAESSSCGGDGGGPPPRVASGEACAVRTRARASRTWSKSPGKEARRLPPARCCRSAVLSASSAACVLSCSRRRRFPASADSRASRTVFNSSSFCLSLKTASLAPGFFSRALSRSACNRVTSSWSCSFSSECFNCELFACDAWSVSDAFSASAACRSRSACFSA